MAKRKNTYTSDLNKRIREYGKKNKVKLIPHQNKIVYKTGQQFGYFDLGNTIMLTHISKR